MFPNRLDFSRFQIERVRERNELTQRLMNLNGMNAGGESYEAIYGLGRIAGEKGREYVLVKNDGVEGGWVLGVVGRKEGAVAPSRHHGEKHVDKVAPGENRKNPIVLDSTQRTVTIGDDEDDDDNDEFEDVPIDGLNRIPKLSHTPIDNELEEFERQQVQQAIRNSKKDEAERRRRMATEDDNSLFIIADEDALMQDIDVDGLFSPTADIGEGANPVNEINYAMHDDDEAFRKVIATSLAEEGEGEEGGNQPSHKHNIHRAKQTKGKKKVAFHFSEEESDEEMNLATAMEISKQSTKPARQSAASKKAKPSTPANPFGGLLPFESISVDFGNSLLGKKKKKQDTAKGMLDIDVTVTASEDEGGFVKMGKEKEKEKEKEPEEDEDKPLPLPPWFAKTTDIRKEVEQEDKLIKEVEAREEEPVLRNSVEHRDIVELSDEEGGQDSDVEMIEALPQKESKESSEDAEDTNTTMLPTEMTMGELAEVIRAVPPVDAVHKESECHKNDKRELSDEVEAHELGQHVGKIDGELESKLEAAGGQPMALPLNSDVARNKSEADDQGSEDEESGDEGTQEEKGSPPLPPETFQPPQAPPDDMDDDQIEAAEAEASQAAEALNDHFSDEEDEELIQQLHEEAEEHARFASALTKDNIPIGRGPSKPTLTAEEYDRELKALRNQQKKDRRDADEVSHTMVSECQQLLRLFGLPYITAPMEAEAQCAELVRLGLVDGIVTDDSDCFLFGGTRVYKNMFNQAKYVECYLSGDLEKEFSLDRKKMVSLAHLLGSDYTEGLPGVGPVTALELLTEFSLAGVNDEEPIAPLKRFREWWEQVQHMGGFTYNDVKDTKFKKKFRKSQATKLSLPSNFPVKDVDEAYLNPEVDHDPSTFKWGVPDLDGLRQFLMSTIGWSQERCDEILVPVVKDMNKRLAEGTQSNITRFFEGTVGAGAFAPRKREARKSKRMDQAMQKLHRIASKGNEGGSGADGEADGEADGDSSVAHTPISMKDAAASGVSTPDGAAITKRKRKGKQPASDGTRRKKVTAIDVSSSSGSDSEGDPNPEQGTAREDNNGGGDEDATATAKKKRKTAASTRGGRKPAAEGAKRGRGRGRGRGGGKAVDV